MVTAAPPAGAAAADTAALPARAATSATATTSTRPTCRAAQPRRELAGRPTAYADQRLHRGPAARPLRPTPATGPPEDGPVRPRRALAAVLVPPGIPASRPPRDALFSAPPGRRAPATWSLGPPGVPA
ncbi:hypothetical protein ACFZC7_08015 [Streptomyces massasporeus]|uniref:hypothetical protein n=1 Tax=Streptomyces massasporeus TaxID=67324 RepID=UPI0036E06F4B